MSLTGSARRGAGHLTAGCPGERQWHCSVWRIEGQPHGSWKTVPSFRAAAASRSGDLGADCAGGFDPQVRNTLALPCSAGALLRALHT
jgi:hypothetical protein